LLFFLCNDAHLHVFEHDCLFPSTASSHIMEDKSKSNPEHRMAKSEAPETARHPSEHTTILLPPVGLKRPVEARVEFGGMTHVGKVRPNNEDHYLIARLCKSVQVMQTSLPPEEDPDMADLEAYLMLVADGLGGAAAGEHASALVIREVKKYALLAAKWFFSTDDPNDEVRMRLLREGLDRIDRQLVTEAEGHAALTGMGSTLTAACSFGADLFLVHVGDSRAYLFRDGTLEQLTTDHTLAQRLVETGLLTPESLRTSRVRHVLTNALGANPGVVPETEKLRLADGDRLLICSDGLTDMLGDTQIAGILQKHPLANVACQSLIEAALDRGGKDNVTVVMANYSIGPEDQTHSARPT
jgi:protein phosphatase